MYIVLICYFSSLNSAHKYFSWPPFVPSFQAGPARSKGARPSGPISHADGLRSPPFDSRRGRGDACDSMTRSCSHSPIRQPLISPLRSSAGLQGRGSLLGWPPPAGRDRRPAVARPARQHAAAELSSSAAPTMTEARRGGISRITIWI